MQSHLLFCVHFPQAEDMRIYLLREHHQLGIKAQPHPV